MEKSIKIFENISSECYDYVTYYKFNRSIDASEKYRDGRIDASNWLNELIYYYIQKEKNFIYEFDTHIKQQKDKISILKDGDYKKGLYDQLNEIENKIENMLRHK
ncbi:MAG: hypothetical protein U9Q04_02095 [Campylobacterota bacterium]|nr:hypothetical protein [Campylobacterota bacterium]